MGTCTAALACPCSIGTLSRAPRTSRADGACPPPSSPRSLLRSTRPDTLHRPEPPAALVTPTSVLRPARCAPRLADFVQELYLKELRAYKPKPAVRPLSLRPRSRRVTDSMPSCAQAATAGATKSYSTPSAPKTPEVPDAAALAKELEAYDACVQLVLSNVKRRARADSSCHSSPPSPRPVPSHPASLARSAANAYLSPRLSTIYTSPMTHTLLPHPRRTPRRSSCGLAVAPSPSPSRSSSPSPPPHPLPLSLLPPAHPPSPARSPPLTNAKRTPRTARPPSPTRPRPRPPRSSTSPRPSAPTTTSSSARSPSRPRPSTKRASVLSLLPGSRVEDGRSGRRRTARRG